MGTVRVAVLAGFEKQVRLLQGNPDKILRANGFKPEFFTEFEADDVVCYERVERLLHAAAVATDCPHFAARLGTQQNINLLGSISHLMLQSNNVGAALMELTDHLLLHVSSGATAKLHVFGEHAYLGYYSSSETGLRKQSDELAMSQSMVVMKALCGEDWKPTRVNFCHGPPDNLRPYLKIFDTTVFFGHDRTEIVFPKTWLELPILQTDPALNMILRTHINQLEENIPQDICARIVQLIRELLPVGSCSTETVAERLAVHPRTMQRMLREEGSSFSELLESVRQEIASERLRNSDMSIIQLSDYLGYADNTAFTRAFKRWYGATPMQWRKSVNTGG
jgi:AraC-like DNA-binding protein